MSATDILGKIGEKVGGEFSDLRVSLGTLYATKVSLGNVVNTIDFTPYATKVSLGETRTSIANLVDGTSVFSDLKATRAEIGDLIVNGTTTTLNTQTLSVEDNIVEVNLQSDGSETAQTGGIEINRGTSNDKAKFIWDDTAGEFQTLLGANATALSVNEIKVPNSSGVKINNIALGDYSTFESAFNTANS
jgi:hypothetical protein